MLNHFYLYVKVKVTCNLVHKGLHTYTEAQVSYRVMIIQYILCLYTEMKCLIYYTPVQTGVSYFQEVLSVSSGTVHAVLNKWLKIMY